jgi:hypothetical protein
MQICIKWQGGTGLGGQYAKVGSKAVPKTEVKERQERK